MNSINKALSILAVAAALGACSDSPIPGSADSSVAFQTNLVSVSATSADTGDTADLELINVQPYTITVTE